MNKDRLLRLASLLEADAKNPMGSKFDLSVWATTEDDVFFHSKEKFKGLDCGTTACAIGLACLSGAFKADGLSWRPTKGENNIDPVYKGKVCWDAVQAFFDLDEDITLRLFSPYHCSTNILRGAEAELAVAKSIRDLVAVS